MTKLSCGVEVVSRGGFTKGYGAWARVSICAAAVLSVYAVPNASAQTVLPYAFVAPGIAGWSGGSEGTLHMGGGADVLFANVVGVGAEFASLSSGSVADGIGTLSINGSYHFPNAGGKPVRPFLTAGYTRFFYYGDAQEKLLNFGGGLHYWFSRHAGLRVEVRDQFYASDPVHFVGARIGIAFR